jgi:hypothetical protein
MFALWSVQSRASISVGLYNTGVDDNGIVLADGQPDPHYQIIEAPDVPVPIQPVTVNSDAWQFGVWVPNDATGSDGSKWIARTADAASLTFGAIYIYRTTFTLPDGVDPNSVEMVGNWSIDDSGRAMLLNGVPAADIKEVNVPASFGTVLPFVVSKGFKSGENTLDFVVTDDGGAVTGLRVESIQLVDRTGPPPTVYSAAADFSVAQNPNGVWSYGWSTRRGSALQLDTASGEDMSFGHLIGWSAPNFDAVLLHIAYAVTSFYDPTFAAPEGTINMHPGPDGQNSIVRWTAPASGAYRIDCWFSGSDFVYPTTTDVAVLHGPTEIFSGEINSYRGAGLPFEQIVQVSVGDTIDFTVGYGSDGNYFGDSTALEATIRPLTGPPGDLNFDGTVNRADLDILMNQIRAHSTNLAYDLNGDGKVDIADARWLALHFTHPGGVP